MNFIHDKRHKKEKGSGANPLRRSRARFPRRGSQAVKLIAKVSGVMRKFLAVPLPLPLGEVSPQVTERAHADALSAKVSSATRNFLATTEAFTRRGKVAKP